MSGASRGESLTSRNFSSMDDRNHDLDGTRVSELWDEIGFHRPVAGFWYRLVLELLTILIPIFFVYFMLKEIYPYPTSRGYSSAFTGLFLLIFQVFDIGTFNTISRFIADENIKRPDRMVAYIQYFIWYQAITGLVQITLLSSYALFIAPNTTLAYGVWIMLMVVIKQWPGFPGVFKGVLSALQQYQKRSLIDFVQSEAIQRVTEILFVLIGRFWGASDPRIGELLGIAIGAVFGLYLDDVIASFISGWLLVNYLKPHGITFRRLFRVEFDWALVKRCTLFGVKTGFSGLLHGATQFFSLTLFLTFIPQYTTYIVLSTMAIELVAITQRLTDQDFTPLFTEAFQNGKHMLVRYYIAHSLRFYVLNSGFTIAIMLTVISMFHQVFLGLGLDRYIMTVPFLIPAMINRASRIYMKFPDQLLIAADKPNLILIFKIIEEVGRVFFLWMFVIVIRVQDTGLWGIVYIVTLGDFPAVFLRASLSYYYLNRKIIKIQVMWWQGIIVPFLSCLILFAAFAIFKILVLNQLFLTNLILAMIIGLLFLISLVLVFYFPLTALLGGWDKNSIQDFKKVKKMSGPSKVLVALIANSVFASASHSLLHDKFRFDDKEAIKELKELVLLRRRNRKISLDKN
ncbi:MAG: hypothetical protein ACTSVI_14485 [Promethearchaeota archaeon]